MNLLTLEPWKDGTILMRFEHILEKSEDIQYSAPVSFNLQGFLRRGDIVAVRETTLSANQWLGDAKRLKFRSDTEVYPTPNTIVEDPADEKRALGSFRSPDDSQIFQKRDRIRSNLNDYDLHDGDSFTITLKPMEIRTFVVTLQSSV